MPTDSKPDERPVESLFCCSYYRQSSGVSLDDETTTMIAQWESANCQEDTDRDDIFNLITERSVKDSTTTTVSTAKEKPNCETCITDTQERSINI